MKKILLVLVLAALIGGGWWVATKYWLVPGPAERFEQIIISAQLGDEEAFLQGFDEESRDLLEAFLALARNYEEVSDRPYRDLVAAEVTSEEIDGKQATVYAKSGNRSIEIPMVYDEGQWLIDGLALESSLR